jgi:hypothetical protein
MNKNLISKIRSMRQLACGVDYARMRQFAVNRHEDTLKILMEVAEDIEKLCSIWFPRDITWHSLSSDKLQNPFTGAYLSYVNKDKRVAWVWVRGGIEFLFNLRTNKCLYVAHRDPINDCGASNQWKSFNYVDKVKDETYSHGIESLVTAPVFEEYFPKVKLEILFDYEQLLTKINEDYNNALKCRELLDKTIEDIAKNGETYMQTIRNLEDMMDDVEGKHSKKKKKGKAK